MKQTGFKTVACAALVTATGAAYAQPTQIFSQDFEDGYTGGGSNPRWSSNMHLSNGTGPFTTFAGQFNNERTTLRLNNPAVPTGVGEYNQYYLTFDLMIIDSWDGDVSPWGPDRINVLANHSPIFSETFANQHDNQSFREPDVGRHRMGYGYAKDSIYRDITVPFTLSQASDYLRLSFEDGGIQGINDESWGIDNVRVSYEVIPTPGAGMLLGLAGVAGVARRRRR